MSRQNPVANEPQIGAATADGVRVTIGLQSDILGERLFAAREDGGRAVQSTLLFAVELDFDEAARTLTWNGRVYVVDDPDAAWSLIQAVADRRQGGRLRTLGGAHDSTAAEARGRALSVGRRLAELAWVYGVLSVVGALIIATQEDAYAPIGLAVGLVSVMVATALLAFGRFVEAWALTADEQAAES